MSEAALSIRAAAAEAPEAPALCMRDRISSFAELATLSEQRIERLKAAGLAEPGLVLGLRPQLDIASITWVLAALELGQPLALLHPRLTELERASLVARLPGFVELGEGPLSPAGPGRLPSSIQSPARGNERALALFFTSGTSGEPKLAVLSRRAFLASARMNAARLGWQPRDRWMLALPLAHVAGLSIVTRSLIARKPVVLPSELGSFDAGRLIEDLRRHECTVVSLVPTMLEAVLDRGAPPPPSLRVALLGGAPARHETLARARAAGWPVYATYGLTEACASVCIRELGDDLLPVENVGPPLPGLELRLHESRILLRGPSLLSGYLFESELVSPFDDDGWFDTGDLGRLDEHGRLEVDGRRSDLILSGGENVYPREIERVFEVQPGVRAVLVFGVPDERWGERPVVLIERGSEFDEVATRRVVDRHLAVFKRPSRWLYVDAMPRNALGKVDRRRARELLAAL